jgi:tyrosyl-DNA phosphodiesterase-1
MESYGYHTKAHRYSSNKSKKSGNGGGAGKEETLTQVLRRYDYSEAQGILIPSIPGYHNITQGGEGRTSVSASSSVSSQQQQQELMGQLKLRQAIREYAKTPATRNKPRPVVCQFTSIGTTSEAYLQTLQSSMDTYLAAKEDPSTNTSETHKSKKKAASTAIQLQLVYPTSEEIRTSIEGYVGGGTVPGTKKNVSKPHLRNLWYKWTSSTATNTNNPLAQSRCVPHIKSYYQVSDSDPYAFDWLCITSHNISQPAWGVIRNNKKYPGQHLYIASWELGVFISPQTLGVDRLVLYRSGAVDQTGTAASTRTANTAPIAVGSVATVPMPYHTHSLEKYSPTDTSWAWDEVYKVPDAFGKYSLRG